MLPGDVRLQRHGICHQDNSQRNNRDDDKRNPVCPFEHVKLAFFKAQHQNNKQYKDRIDQQHQQIPVKRMLEQHQLM